MQLRSVLALDCPLSAPAAKAPIRRRRRLPLSLPLAAAGAEPAPSRARIRFGRALALLLPSSIAGVLAWGYSHPDEEGCGEAATPHQVAAAGETLVNWSATHSVQPRWAAAATAAWLCASRRLH